eukprot:COSAG06_NODE_4901_length_3872_cov_6065.039491_4_plen_31_part_00
MLLRKWEATMHYSTNERTHLEEFVLALIGT